MLVAKINLKILSLNIPFPFPLFRSHFCPIRKKKIRKKVYILEIFNLVMFYRCWFQMSNKILKLLVAFANGAIFSSLVTHHI